MYEQIEHIRAAPEAVWATLVDVERWSEWTPTVRRLERVESGPFGMGSSARIWLKGAPGASTWAVSEFAPGRSFAWWTRSLPGIRMTAGHEVSAHEGGARLALTITISGPLAFLGRLLFARIARSNIALEAAGLKRWCERSA